MERVYVNASVPSLWAVLAGVMFVAGCSAAARADQTVEGLTSDLKDRAASSNGDTGSGVDAEDQRADDDLKHGRRHTVVPILDCVDEVSSSQLQAHWGYNNPSSTSVRRKIGPKNGFRPNPENRGQPTLLAPGPFHDVFTTTFSSNDSLTWQLDGNGATANKKTKHCTIVAAGAGGAAAGAGGAADGGAGGSGGSGAVGNAAGSGGTGGSSDSVSCAQCETGTSACQSPLNACATLSGVAASGPKAGVARAQLCQDLVQCVHTSSCAAYLSDSDCYCGKGVDSSACFSGDVPATGSCKAEVEAAAESTAVVDIALRYSNTTYASGAAIEVIELCDYLHCNQCLGSSPPGSGPGVISGWETDACGTCESLDHNGEDFCPTRVEGCIGLQGVATAGPKQGVARSQLCHEIVQCVHATHCASNKNDTDCYCGVGADPDRCPPGTRNGPCSAQMEAGAESTDPEAIFELLHVTQYALGAAWSVIQDCDELSCSTQCL